MSTLTVSLMSKGSSSVDWMTAGGASDAVGECGRLSLRLAACEGNSNVAGVVGSDMMGTGIVLDLRLLTLDADSEVVMLRDVCRDGAVELEMSSGSDMTVFSSGVSVDCSLRRWKPEVVGGDPARD